MIILLLITGSLSAQSDFEQRYFTMTDRSLPAIEDLSQFNFNKTPFVKRSLNEFELNARNYRSPVDMMAAVSGDRAPRPQNIDLESLQSRLPGVRGDRGYISDGKTRVENQVYQEMRGLDFIDRCPPGGVCARCAPYRLGRRGF